MPSTACSCLLGRPRSTCTCPYPRLYTPRSGCPDTRPPYPGRLVCSASSLRRRAPYRPSLRRCSTHISCLLRHPPEVRRRSQAPSRRNCSLSVRPSLRRTLYTFSSLPASLRRTACTCSGIRRAPTPAAHSSPSTPCTASLHTRPSMRSCANTRRSALPDS